MCARVRALLWRARRIRFGCGLSTETSWQRLPASPPPASSCSAASCQRWAWSWYNGRGHDVEGVIIMKWGWSLCGGCGIMWRVGLLLGGNSRGRTYVGAGRARKVVHITLVSDAPKLVGYILLIAAVRMERRQRHRNRLVRWNSQGEWWRWQSQTRLREENAGRAFFSLSYVYKLYSFSCSFFLFPPLLSLSQSVGWCSLIFLLKYYW